ncbi:hypothetical protein [Alteribacillus bidgolensis]|uniref:Uncharacterized protein n=1 Tax=Alteribacillus bidgolensis TaxID=930129 RepID=A0A1G8JBX3_9BACI|nr:hypothetical protein [Alteribacillus bidgolensis]SDI28487.1 hypothetical protein SAMN05216352_106132 [Alteribacillus bidgolensis]
MNRYHCCATCKWYEVRKTKGEKVTYHCIRLGYETHPKYQFNCWDPKEKVRKRMEQEDD